MERSDVPSDERARQKQRLQKYALKHGLRILETGFALVCRRGRNNAYQSCYALVLQDTSHDKNAARHGFPETVECILSILGNNQISCKPVYVGIELRNKQC